MRVENSVYLTVFSKKNKDVPSMRRVKQRTILQTIKKNVKKSKSRQEKGTDKIKYKLDILIIWRRVWEWNNAMQ